MTKEQALEAYEQAGYHILPLGINSKTPSTSNGLYDADLLGDPGVYNTENGDWFLDNTTDPLRTVPKFGGTDYSPAQSMTEGSDR